MFWLDSGNLMDTPGPVGDRKSEALVAGMETIGYTAVGVGERDLDVGVERYLELTEGAGFARLSANLVRGSDGAPWVEPYRIVEVGDRKIGLFALTRFNPTLLEKLSDGDSLMVRSPLDTARDLVPRLLEQADVVVLLASMPIDDARLIVRKVEGVDLVLGAGGGQVTPAPRQEGGTSVIYAGKEGQDLAEVRLYFDDDAGFRKQLTMHRLDRAYPEEPAMAGYVQGVLREINETHRRLAEERQRRIAAGEAGDSEADDWYLGVEGCEPCHPEAVAVWWSSAHATAFETLEKAEADFNPECVGCHVVSFREPGGFVDALTTPHRKNVQCEACHGPAGSHPEDPYRGGYGEVRVSTCTGCHDPEHGPDFNFYADWPKIRHGAD